MRTQSIPSAVFFGVVLVLGFTGCGDAEESKSDTLDGPAEPSTDVDEGGDDSDGGDAPDDSGVDADSDGDGGADSGTDTGVDGDGGDAPDDSGVDADSDGDGGADSGTDTGVDGDAPDDSAADTDVDDDGGDPDDSDAIRVGDELVIELPSNPSTGFGWEVQTPSADDESVLELASSEYIPDEAAGGMSGSGGTEVFRFRATGVGSTTVLLHYVRPWESEPPTDTHSQEVTVVE